MKKIAILMILALALSLYAVSADVSPGEASFTENDNGFYNVTSADTLSATGGSIFTADLQANVSTVRWVGVSGNVSGSIVLGDTGGNTLFEWAGTTAIAVYATLTSVPIDWTVGLDNDAGDGGTIEANFSFVDNALSINDDYVSTFGDGPIALTSNMFTASGTYAVSTEDGTNSAYWTTLGLNTNGGVASVFAGNVVNAGHSDYKGDTVQFQIMIPEQGGEGNEAATQWDLWIELE